MGGLDGNARIRMTPEMAGQRRHSVGISKDEQTDHIEKFQGNSVA